MFSSMVISEHKLGPSDGCVGYLVRPYSSKLDVFEGYQERWRIDWEKNETQILHEVERVVKEVV